MKPILFLMSLLALAIGFGAGAVAEKKFGLILHFQGSASLHHEEDAVAPADAADEPDTHEDEYAVELTEAQVRELGLEMAAAGPGPLQHVIPLPGEIVVNADRLAHVVTRVAGVARDVRATLGDQVVAGQVLAVLESRQLADTKAAYLGALRKLELANTRFEREQSLWEKKISSEQELLDAKQAQAETQIELRTAEQKLHALGFSNDYIQALPSLSDDRLTRYEIVAPFGGTVIGKHITIGEALKDDAEAFIVADLAMVWVQLSVSQTDLPFIREGQEASIVAGPGVAPTTGQISYVGSIMGEATRTALARVVLANAEGQFRPGLFVSAEIVADSSAVDVRVPIDAIETLEGRPCVFVRTQHGFEPQFVSVGRSDRGYVEVTSGLAAGESYVVKGAFELKAELVTSNLGSHAGHGH